MEVSIVAMVDKKIKAHTSGERKLTEVITSLDNEAGDKNCYGTMFQMNKT